jgi:ubiquinone/menaquinone biosynthesis C-methylase UbiE
LTGIDLDEKALEIRENITKDLDETILGDLTKLDLEANKFDAIYSSYVLEHIDHAELVMQKFCQWLKPGGLNLLQIPDRDSVFGLITRTTPFFLHVLYKQYIQGNRNAGLPGCEPYPTYYHKVVSRK